jgi:long-chain acyl-CoA synthetase
MLVQDFLQKSADRFPDKLALIHNRQRLTYAEVEALANKLANALLANGIKRGDRVVIFLPNVTETVISIFGILKASGIFVVINPTTKKDKLIYILNNCKAAALITSYSNAAMASDIQDTVPSLKLTVFCMKTNSIPAQGISYDFEELLDSYPPTRPACVTINQDLACLIYTSGSTGEPKGVMEGHNNVVFATGSIIKYLENTHEDIVINVLPLSFDYGLYQLLMVFRFGGTLVLEKSFTYPSYVLKKIETEQVTGFPGVPTMFSIIVQMNLDKFDLSRLRYITNTAAALPPNHIAALRKKFPTVTIYSMYGLTECKRTLYLPPDQIDNKTSSVGIAIPGTEVWIEDNDGNRLGPDEVGELVIRGSHVMRGYWDDPETTAKVYRPGPTPGERILFSGDLFKVDEDGYFYFVSRKDDILKSRGEKVPPKEVEDVLYGIEGVVEAAVVGVPDKILGQAIKAFVVVNNSALTENDIKRHCSKHLEDFMVPSYIEFRDSLPKTSSGKIRRKDIK